ncbi:hypothetical protein [Aeromonas caviae]|uniref:hypothetical protein n=2 Tax=Aeromonas caviae TaxID=648 RepID=UPI0030DBBC97
MARRGSLLGLSIKVVKAIDRAGKQAARDSARRQKAAERENARAEREYQKFLREQERDAIRAEKERSALAKQAEKLSIVQAKERLKDVYRSSYHLTPASNRCLVYATLVRTSFGINFRPFLNML